MLALLLLFLVSGGSHPVVAQTSEVVAQARLDSTIAAGEADAQEPVKRGLAKYNEFDLRFTSLRLGYGLAIDFSNYIQDDASRQQVLLEPQVGLRDFRFMFKGKFKTQRPVSWTMGIMYDGALDDWFFRQTGIMFAVPSIYSNFFVGRTKEGYSQYKVMVGYDLWTSERSPFLDAVIPILGDGIKWTISGTRRRVLLNLGWYNDALSENEKFATYDNQFVGRFVWLPTASEQGKLVHLAVMGRVAEPDDGKFQARSRPEDFLAPFFVDTGKFDADGAHTLGFEVYYRHASWLFGGEYGWQTMDAPAAGDPLFHGGNLSATWLVTGEVRGYNLAGGFFNAVSPRHGVWNGGRGCIEATLNVSFLDLDDGNLRGGTFWRITPVVKWHLMDYTRVEAGYGYGVLDRFDLEGKTHFFQGRLLTAL